MGVGLLDERSWPWALTKESSVDRRLRSPEN